MKEIASALVKAQRAFGPALKTNTNPHFKTKYADLSACVEAVIDALNDNGIALIQRQHESESGVTVETVFVHESGEMLDCGRLHVPAVKNDPQGYGSALTYARRYSLMSACGIAPEDDDGNAAQREAAKPAARVTMSERAIADHIASFDEAGTPAALKVLGDKSCAIADAMGDESAKAKLAAAYLKRKKALTTKEAA